MRKSSRHPRIRAALTALAGCAVALAVLTGCGSEAADTREAEISLTEAPTHLDPAYAYHGTGLEPVAASELFPLVYTPLLTYRHESGEVGAELIPGLARDLPEVSDDGRTYTLELRGELTYSDGTEVRASDFEQAAKRVLAADSEAADLLAGVVGAGSFRLAPSHARSITGISTDDESGEITIRLVEPDASFPHVLALWALGLVPRHTQLRDRSAAPPRGVGPYEIAEVDPGRRLVLERSEHFSGLAIPDIPTGNLDTIAVELGESVDEQAQAVLANERDYMHDPPPAEVKATLLSEDSGRYRENVAAGTHLFYLDPGEPPFDHPRVRRAANMGVDRAELARAFGGGLEPGCAFLPPGFPGHDEDLDTVECPFGDPSEPPQVSRARQLVVEAGAAGTPVTVWGSDERGVAEATEAYAGMLEAIGLDARVRLVERQSWLRRLEEGRAPANTGFVPSFPAFPHPLRAYSLLTPGADPRPRIPVADDRAVSEELAVLALEPEPDRVSEEWAELDRRLISPPLSGLVVVGHPRMPTFVSERLDLDRAIFHPVFLNDWSSFALERAEEEAQADADQAAASRSRSQPAFRAANASQSLLQ